MPGKLIPLPEEIKTKIEYKPHSHAWLKREVPGVQNGTIWESYCDCGKSDPYEFKSNGQKFPKMDVAEYLHILEGR